MRLEYIVFCLTHLQILSFAFLIFYRSQSFHPKHTKFSTNSHKSSSLVVPCFVNRAMSMFVLYVFRDKMWWNYSAFLQILLVFPSWKFDCMAMIPSSAILRWNWRLSLSHYKIHAVSYLRSIGGWLAFSSHFCLYSLFKFLEMEISWNIRCNLDVYS